MLSLLHDTGASFCTASGTESRRHRADQASDRRHDGCLQRVPSIPMRTLQALLLSAPLVLLSACGGSHSRATLRTESPRLVSILVEVYDPVTNLVWENVSVRIVEADQEWSQCTCVSPFTDWYLTDATGRVLLDEFLLADAEVGFAEDGSGRAILGPQRDEDEATVVLEIDAVGFVPVIVEVPLRWDTPDVFVEVPFN